MADVSMAQGASMSGPRGAKPKKTLSSRNIMLYGTLFMTAGAYGASKAAIWSITNSLRQELRPQHTQVVGAHVGYIDTDMTEGINAPKLAPAEVARRIIDGLEAGAAEVLVDGDKAHVIRVRETTADQIRGEFLINV